MKKFKFKKNNLNKVSPKNIHKACPHAKTKLIQKTPTCFPQNLKSVFLYLPLTPLFQKNKENPQKSPISLPLGTNAWLIFPQVDFKESNDFNVPSRSKNIKNRILKREPMKLKNFNRSQER